MRQKRVGLQICSGAFLSGLAMSGLAISAPPSVRGFISRPLSISVRACVSCSQTFVSVTKPYNLMLSVSCGVNRNTVQHTGPVSRAILSGVWEWLKISASLQCVRCGNEFVVFTFPLIGPVIAKRSCKM